MELRHAIGHTIRSIRTEQGLSLRQVADSQFFSYGHLSDVERGVKEASTVLLECIAKGLNRTTTQLMKEIYEYLEEQDGNS